MLFINPQTRLDECPPGHVHIPANEQKGRNWDCSAWRNYNSAASPVLILATSRLPMRPGPIATRGVGSFSCATDKPLALHVGNDIDSPSNRWIVG
jgi:hypothetical protein